MTDRPHDRGPDGRSTDLPSGGGVPAWIAASLNFCSRCGAPLEFGAIEGEDRDRLACTVCGHIAYVNPRLVVTTFPITEAGEIVLIRRGIEPGKGSWAQPGGFLEIDETVHEAAIRETREETGLLVEPGEIVGLYTRLEASVVTIAFEARIVGGTAAPTPEATEIVAYAPEDIPWAEIAFKTTRFALHDWLERRRPDVPNPSDHRRDVTDLDVRADQVIRDFYRLFAASVGGHVVERDGVVACLGVHPSPIVTNTAWRSDPSADRAAVLRVIDETYEDAGFIGGLLTSARTDADLETAAAASGRHVVAELPVMTVDRATFVTPATTPTRRVDPIADLEAFRTVLVDGFFEGDAAGRSLIEATFADPRSIGGSDVGLFLAELEGRPASVAGAWVLGGDAAIGWVATVPEARRRGLGAAVTARAVEFALDRGAELVALEASPTGRPVYERLGFSAVGLDRIWEPRPTSGR